MVEIVLDRSRPFSEVRGERMQDDPHYGVAYMQDGLPFDAEGNLFPDNGKKEPWFGQVDGQKVQHFPLYNDAMRARVKRKTEMLERSAARTSEVDEREKAAEAERQEEQNEINLAAWLKGLVRYEPQEVYAAVKLRYGVNARKKRDVLEALADLKPALVPYDQWAEEHKKVLDLPKAA